MIGVQIVNDNKSVRNCRGNYAIPDTGGLATPNSIFVKIPQPGGAPDKSDSAAVGYSEGSTKNAFGEVDC
jgi:hypothetical protein